MHPSTNTAPTNLSPASDIYSQNEDSPPFLHGYQPLILPPPPISLSQNHHRQSTVLRRNDHQSINIPLQQQQQQRQHIIQYYPPKKSNDFCFSCYPFCCGIFVRKYKERSKRIDVVSRLVLNYLKLINF